MKELTYEKIETIINVLESEKYKRLNKLKPKWVTQLEAAGIKVCPSIYDRAYVWYT